MNIDRVKKMEGYLLECADAADALNTELERMENIGKHMTELFSYYGSEAWYEDREEDLPDGVRAGVLSEDAVYDQITAVRDTSIRMLELAADILKNRL